MIETESTHPGLVGRIRLLPGTTEACPIQPLHLRKSRCLETMPLVEFRHGAIFYGIPKPGPVPPPAPKGAGKHGAP